MRTVKRHSTELNKGKYATLEATASSYAAEKRYWLGYFQQAGHVHAIGRPRIARDEHIRNGYRSPFGLQARMWKLALTDAAETMDKYWQATFVEVRRLVFRHGSLSQDQKHYCFRILKDYRWLELLFLHQYPEFKGLTCDERRKAGNYLNRIIRRKRGVYPHAGLTRSFALDAQCYNLFTSNNNQYIKVMTLEKGRRVVVPLTGSTPIKGNIRVVLSGQNHAAIHYTSKLKVPRPIPGAVEAVDFGYTEVATDASGTQYGENLGTLITEASDRLKTRMQRRHKLHALEKKLAGSGDAAGSRRAARIRRFNLGTEKLGRVNERARATIEQEINTALNELFRTKRSEVFVTEDLSHVFSFTRGRNWNRKLSSWVKGTLQDRTRFKALAGGSRHEQVNAAYTSQTCPACGFVEAKNRRGDRFQCLNCGHGEHADRVAATNLLARYHDPEVTRYTPYREVKHILQERFHRRLETPQGGTVPSRTLDTVNLATSTADRKKATSSSLPPGGPSKSETQTHVHV